MVIRDTDFDYFVEYCIRAGAPKSASKDATAIHFKDNSQEIKLDSDSDFGHTRLNRATCVITVLGKDGKQIWSSGSVDSAS